MSAKQSQEMKRALAQVQAAESRGETLGRAVIAAAHKNQLYTASIYRALAALKKKSVESLIAKQ